LVGEESRDAAGVAEGFDMCAETAGFVTMLESASEMVPRRSCNGSLGFGYELCCLGSVDSSCDGDCSVMLGRREFSLLAMCSEGSLEGGGVGIAACVDMSDGGISCGRSSGGSQSWSSRLVAAGEVKDESSCDLCSEWAIVLVSWGADREGAGTGNTLGVG
jgi:hypothetical protein